MTHPAKRRVVKESRRGAQHGVQHGAQHGAPGAEAAVVEEGGVHDRGEGNGACIAKGTEAGLRRWRTGGPRGMTREGDGMPHGRAMG